MEVKISASNFMRQANYFYQCYLDNKQFGIVKDWKFEWKNGELIDHVSFTSQYHELFDIHVLYFNIHEEDEPEVTVCCGTATENEVFISIIKGLEVYYYLKSDPEISY